MQIGPCGQGEPWPWPLVMQVGLTRHVHGLAHGPMPAAQIGLKQIGPRGQTGEHWPWPFVMQMGLLGLAHPLAHVGEHALAPFIGGQQAPPHFAPLFAPTGGGMQGGLNILSGGHSVLREKEREFA